MEDLRVTVQHRHDIVTVPHIRDVEDPRLDGNVEPDDGVQRIGVGRGTAVVVDGGVGPHFDQLSHRGVLGIRLGYVGLLLADHVEGDQRIAVDVRVSGDADRLNRAQPRELIRAGCERNGGHGVEAQRHSEPPNTKFHRSVPLAWSR